MNCIHMVSKRSCSICSPAATAPSPTLCDCTHEKFCTKRQGTLASGFACRIDSGDPFIQRDGFVPSPPPEATTTTDGRTHYDGCWDTRGHHDCAREGIRRLTQELAEARAETAKQIDMKVGIAGQLGNALAECGSLRSRLDAAERELKIRDSRDDYDSQQARLLSEYLSKNHRTQAGRGAGEVAVELLEERREIVQQLQITAHVNGLKEESPVRVDLLVSSALERTLAECARLTSENEVLKLETVYRDRDGFVGTERNWFISGPNAVLNPDRGFATADEALSALSSQEKPRG